MDSALTPNGIRQAEELANFLKGIKFDALFTSDLGRAINTAEILNMTLQIEPFIQEPLLRERNFGLFHGMTREQAEKDYPEASQKIWGGKATEKTPGGESRMDVHARAMEFLHTLPGRFPDKRLLIVTHGGVINAILREVLQISPDAPRRFKLPNTGINILHYEAPHWYLNTLGMLPFSENGSVYDETV